MTASINVTFLGRPHIVEAGEGGFYVLLHNGNGWLCGDRHQALTEFSELVRIERNGR
jgi:hypothetical protein